MGKLMPQQTDYKYGFSDDVKPKIEFDKGLTPMVIRQISDLKNEPRWMLDYRLDSYKVFLDKSNLTWGEDLSLLNDLKGSFGNELIKNKKISTNDKLIDAVINRY